ncbi:hypothetical protein [Polyangium jinanense]|uniref:Uncharacterized protein n=1 Tax=Polyangium jinanense TaxID=2829994 RepID=A0A9X3XIP5_9BACT|nr:hypothetical protein [Polyangium jinanense]MDC3988801.1 hypothetical protein [Polyangium jinanense]
MLDGAALAALSTLGAALGKLGASCSTAELLSRDLDARRSPRAPLGAVMLDGAALATLGAVMLDGAALAALGAIMLDGAALAALGAVMLDGGARGALDARRDRARRRSPRGALDARRDHIRRRGPSRRPLWGGPRARACISARDTRPSIHA